VKRVVIWIIIIAAAAFIGFGMYLYFAQNRFAFFPGRELSLSPGELGLPFDDVFIEVADGQRVHGWFFPTDSANSGEDRPVVLFCHGNAGNISHRLETVVFLRDMGADVLLFDYRGYGRSDGSPTEANVYADAEACYRWLTGERGYKATQVVAFGRSLGGVVAVDLASRQPLRGLIVESSLTSARDMARRMFPFFPVGWLMRIHFDSIGKIGTVSCPVLVTHSPDDEMVPYEMGRGLYDAARPPRRFVELTGGHNDRHYFDFDSYRSAVRDILFGTTETW